MGSLPVQICFLIFMNHAVGLIQKSECEKLETCSECRSVPGCSWCQSPQVELLSRCNIQSETEKICPANGVENTASMEPEVIQKPYYIKEEYHYHKQMQPKHVRLSMNVGEQKTINFSYMFISSGTNFVHDLPANVEVKVFKKGADVTNSGVRGVFNGAKLNFKAKLLLTSCPEDPLLWNKENHFRLNATEGQGMHIYLSFLCTCSCDKFNAKGQICRNDKKTYTDVNPCSQKDTCTECLRNADCNWCSDPAYSYLDGSPLPRCNNDLFFTSKLCPIEKKLDPPRALSGSEDCTDCQHSCSGGICSENKQDILEENTCSSHLTCSDCIHAEDCGWCSEPEKGPRCNRLSNWVNLTPIEDNQVVCKADIQGWKVNISNTEPKIINNNRNTFAPWNYNGNPYSRSEFEQSDNIVHATAKIGVPVKLSVEWDFNENGINWQDHNPRDTVELSLTSKTYLCWECEDNNYPFFTDSVALEYEYICDGTKCEAGIDTFETTEKLQFDVSLTLLDCKKKDMTIYPVFLVLHNAYSSKGKTNPFGILKIILDMPYCDCKCDQDCNAGFERVHPSCGGANRQCGKCVGCPDGTFGDFCECNTDGTERQKSNLTFEQIPTVRKGQKGDKAGNVPVKHIDKFSFGHVILEESAPAYQIQCTENGNYCKSISSCNNGEQSALYADHRLLPGSELTLKLSLCNWYGPFVGFATYMAEEIYAWGISLWNEKEDAILVCDYKKIEWNNRYWDMEMQHVDEASKHRYLMGKDGTTIKLKVTESEVIWSWDGFTKGDGGYMDGKYRFKQTSNETEMRHQFDIKTKAYYPVIIFNVCTGEESSFEILESKVGQDDVSPVKLSAKSPVKLSAKSP